MGTTRRDRHRESGSSQQAPSNPSGTAPPRRLYTSSIGIIEERFRQTSFMDKGESNRARTALAQDKEWLQRRSRSRGR